jgi:hypothetical protein
MTFSNSAYIQSRLKRLQAARKQREREKKDLEVNNRRNLSNVRVRHKTQVHIQGLTTKVANEDVSLSFLGFPGPAIRLKLHPDFAVA